MAEPGKEPGVLASETVLNTIDLLSFTLMDLHFLIQMDSRDLDLPNCPMWTLGRFLCRPHSFLLRSWLHVKSTSPLSLPESL